MYRVHCVCCGEHIHDYTASKLPKMKCLIRWKWLAGVVVPYQTEGQIRASRVQLIKPVNCL